MTLLDLCEPFFQYLCRLNRSARKGVSFEPSTVRAELKGMLGEIGAQGRQMAGQGEGMERVELALIYFADFMIKESSLPFAREWKELAHERDLYAGDEHFFDLLDDTLKEQGEAAEERLAVFYTCLGLGFTGFYTGQPEYLRRKMLEVSTRIRGRMDAELGEKICKDAYEHLNTDDLVQPPGRRLIGMAVALIGLVIALFAVNAWLYHQKSGELRTSLNTLIETTRPADAESGSN